MRVCLLNPNWSFDGSIYFGCREPHLPLEFGYARALLEQHGHVVKLIDAQLMRNSEQEVRDEVKAFEPELTVVTTAPSYLFWRCAPPELRVPMRLVNAVRDCGGDIVVVGPHASSTPSATLGKLGLEFAIQGECEQAILDLAEHERDDWASLSGVAFRDGAGRLTLNGGPRAVSVKDLDSLAWPRELVEHHHHHHHRFDREPNGFGAEVESSRGCPYSCAFCAKDNFRDKFRQRPLEVVLEEIDGLIASGVTYVYFVDEIFLPNRPLLEALRDRPIEFGVQMRIDLFDNEMLELLGAAGCVSVEAGVESITREGRSLLAKRCKKSTEELKALLIDAKRGIPFVQANLLNATTDPVADVQSFRADLIAKGVWVNDPVPMFPYPGSPAYTLRWGPPDDLAWERALDHYLKQFDTLSEIQDERPQSLAELEGRVCA